VPDALVWLLDFRWAHGLSTSTARVFFLVFFALVTLFGVHFRREYVYRGAEDQARWRDLRLWVVVIMAIQTVIYLIL
jgi:hypothetical protein